jgi:hypothetical protein
MRTGELRRTRDFDKAEWCIPEQNGNTTACTLPQVPAVIKLYLDLHDITGNNPRVMASQIGATGPIEKTYSKYTLSKLHCPGYMGGSRGPCC